jgi:hypothetical protein
MAQAVETDRFALAKRAFFPYPNPHSITMEPFRYILQVVIALGILNVWVLRAARPSPFRGGGARDLRREFAHYGLPFPMMLLVGFLKISCALALVWGIWFREWVEPAALVLAVLMAGAVAMHAKVGDSLKRMSPSIGMLLLCQLLAWIA